MTFNEKLKKAEENFNKKGFKKYEKKSMIEVLNYNKQYRKENPKEYPYNSNIVDFILEKEKVDNEMLDHLGTEVYLSQHDIKIEKDTEEEIERKKDGYTRITNKNVCDIPVDVKVELLLSTRSLVGALRKSSNVCRVLKDGDGEVFFLLPRCRRKGYTAQTLANGEYPSYYKVL